MPQVAAAALLAAFGQRPLNARDETPHVPATDNPAPSGESSISGRNVPPATRPED